MKIVPVTPTDTILLSQDEKAVLYRALLEADPLIVSTSFTNVNGVTDADLHEALTDYTTNP